MGLHFKANGSYFSPQYPDQIELTAMIYGYVSEGQTTQVIKAVTQEIVVLKQGQQVSSIALKR